MSRFTDKIDMRFDYVPSGKTDIRRTFARERKRLAELAEKQKAAEAEQSTKVRTLTKEKRNA